jgi:Zn-dependent peptidase ImmA (M78 family)
MLSEKRFQQIERDAATLLTKFKIKKAPVPVDEVIKKLDIDLIEYNLGDGASGVLVVDSGKGTIGYNPKDSHGRQRFTMAHELGHFLLHKTDSELFVDKDFLMKFRNPSNTYTDNELKHEREANAFAAALLMPKVFLDKELSDEDLAELSESDLLAELSKRFEVSIAAMSFRLANLNTYY